MKQQLIKHNDRWTTLRYTPGPTPGWYRVHLIDTDSERRLSAGMVFPAVGLRTWTAFVAPVGRLPVGLPARLRRVDGFATRHDAAIFLLQAHGALTTMED